MRSRIATGARLLKLLSLLHERRFWSGAELAEELGVTTRSVRRDIEQLRELGYPVHAGAGVGGGYGLGAGADLPPLPLDDDEALAVALGLRAAATGPVAGLEDAAIRALAKLEQVLPARLRERLDGLGAVSVGIDPGGPKVDGRLLATLAAACRAERRLRFEYVDARDEVTQRRVEPYRLVHSTTRWYLFAWDEVREDWRTFRVDRVRGEPRSGHRFRPRPIPAEDVTAYVDHTTGFERAAYRARVLVHGSAEAVRARIPAPYGRVEELADDRCILETAGDELHWIAFYIGQLDLELEILEPPDLAEYFAAWAGRFRRAAGLGDP